MTTGTAGKSHDIYLAGNELLVVLRGRIVLEELNALKSTVLPKITRGLSQVYVDLKPVEYVDSAGLGLLIGFKMTAKTNGARIALMEPNKSVSDVLSISKLDGIFDFLGGAEAQDVRDRLAIESSSQAATAGAFTSDFSGDNSIPTVNSDGTLNVEEDDSQKREQVDEFCRRAVEFMRQGDYENSIECYKSALELEPNHLPALNNLAIVYEKQPSWHALAVEKWQVVLELSRQRGDEKHRDRAERHLADLAR